VPSGLWSNENKRLRGPQPRDIDSQSKAKQHGEPESDSHLATTSVPDEIPGSPSETPLVRSPPLLTPRSLYDATENARPWSWTDSRSMRLDQGPVRSPADAE
jgi:hypothetical protein